MVREDQPVRLKTIHLSYPDLSYRLGDINEIQTHYNNRNPIHIALVLLLCSELSL